MGLNRLRLQAILSSQARRRDLPYLCELEYLESTGEQWIRLNIPLGSTENIRHETSIMVTQLGTKQQEGYAVATRWYSITEDGHYTIGSESSKIMASTTSYDNVVLETINQNCSLIVNDEVILTRTSACSSSPDTYLFVANEHMQNPCYIRKKYHKFYVDGALLFDGIPVLDYDMKPAMYDRVTKKLFYNEGTGADFKWAIKRGDTRAYTKLEYLESTGEQYIDIGYQLQTTDTVKHVVTQQYAHKSATQYENHVTAPRYFGIDTNSCYTLGGGTVVTMPASLDSFDKIVFEGTPTQGILTVNDTLVASRASNVSRSLNIYIFGACGSSNELQYPCFVKKKSHQIYVNDLLIFDGIPVLDYLLRPAMFDRVSGKLFYNEGTGADFKYGLRGTDGNLYTSVPYIESTGKEIIRVNMPITGTQKVKHVCCQQYVTQEGSQLEGFVETGRAFGTKDGYYYIASYASSDVMSSTTDFDKIVFESEVGWQSLTVNGTEILTKRFADMKDISGIRLFAAGGNSHVCYLKKKYHLFYLDNKLVFAGVAVIDTKGVAGLFDIVTKTMFRTNSGQFIVGE